MLTLSSKKYTLLATSHSHVRRYFHPYKNLKSALQKNPPIVVYKSLDVSKLLCGKKPIIVFGSPGYLDFAASQCKIQIIQEELAATQIPDWFSGLIFSRKLSPEFREKVKIILLKLYNIDSVEQWVVKKYFPSFNLRAAQDASQSPNSPASLQLLFPVFIFQCFSCTLGAIVCGFERAGPKVYFDQPAIL